MPARQEVEQNDCDAPTARSLVRRQASGSESAATALYDQYADRIRKLVRRKLSRELGARLDADDIVQSVFRRFFGANRREPYSLPSDENLWDLLLTITLNRLRSEEQFHRAQKRNVAQTTTGDALDQLPQGDGHEESLDLVVTEALALLPPSHRAVVHYRLDGYDVSEIAQYLRRSKRTIERMLQDVRQQLRTILELETPDDNLEDTLPL